MSVTEMSSEKKVIRLTILSGKEFNFFYQSCTFEMFVRAMPNERDYYAVDVIDINSLRKRKNKGACGRFRDIGTLIIPDITNVDYSLDSISRSTIRELYKDSTRLIAFNLGGLLLAQAGLLDNNRTVCDRDFRERYSQRYPQVNVMDNVLFTENENIYCSIGGIAAFDLGLHIIEKDFGVTVANYVMRKLSLYRRANSVYGEDLTTGLNTKHEKINEIIDWAKSNLGLINDIDCLAKKAYLSRRSFDRKFRKIIGLSPKKWLSNQRLVYAKQILETSDLRIDEIAHITGFGTGVNFRKHFIQAEGVTPTQYRNMYNSNMLLRKQENAI
ncbi:helix-turn-helix domain-containing protein [Exilibacterium tricleocarpae]|uniref:Helix-turn-helix domain-containing protein n=1 Tax=Exilibacterium tricleocarpae TaxID=2591008 RepID=A0A545U476_9GAMM|nr:helix-turn-helix domain-containing protein [Exilibacterium tricleocarpae]TQV84272.1 helix-turn-helix domain-containing protein [Exilibacterium tricleocarpae]